MSLLTYMKCHLCGKLLAESDQGFERHLARYHAVKHVPTCKSKRPKAEIIKEFEAKIKNHLIDGTQHEQNCSCMVCFQRHLDALVDFSQDSLNGL